MLISDSVLIIVSYRLTLMQKCFDQLQNYCSWRKHRQVLIHAVEEIRCVFDDISKIIFVKSS